MRTVENKNPLDLFHPSVREWFAREFGEPTPPQALAWPSIARRSHVLIHAPTGAGKTLAAFLWAINELQDEPPTGQAARSPGKSGKRRANDEKILRSAQDDVQPGPLAGVRVLYVSPLKALNYDIERNLRAPLAGIQKIARARELNIPEIRVGVRTGDTPARDRAAMVRRPPQILITTPESLYLILTSPVARRILRTVRTVIVDEIHAVCGSKRGVHLALSLERLERLSPEFQRIGLSATQRPLEEVARFLGGQRIASDGGMKRFEPRPVEIVDAAYRKPLDLSVVGMPEAALGEAAGSVWPRLIPSLLDDIQSHRTTLVFCNSRMQAERTADRLNAQLTLEDAGRQSVGEPALAPGGAPIGEGLMGTGLGAGIFKAHHGSISDEVRHELEEDLKAGRLPALIGTSSLELGIDIGSIDLVVQLQSPKSVGRGLQRVGRSGHKVGETTVGRIYATHNEDLLECAVVARGMAEGKVEAVRTPTNSLDVLAQQIVAAVSVQDWRQDEMYDLVRCAYPYRDLDRASFESVLKLVSGRYSTQHYRPLRPRVFWDPESGLLSALPGARLQAMANAGAIIDHGEFAVYLADGKTRIGELDEEFVWETREGDVFTLGSQVWRAMEILDDRVIAEPAPGDLPRMPFWKGEYPWRPFELSLKLARMRSDLATRLAPFVDSDDDPPHVMEWLRKEFRLDEAGARQAIGYVRRQLRTMGAISSDRTVIVETYADSVGDLRLVIHSPFGGKVNAAWAIAIASVITERTGVTPDMQVSDDGMMFRIAEAETPVPDDLIRRLTPAEVRERLLADLQDSPVFGALFRANATRALLMPASPGRRRTPFWMQRRRAKDLLSIARQFPDFPILLETYRDCLEDALDLSALNTVVERVHAGEIRVVNVETRVPSPVAQSLNWAFTNVYLYEWDTPKAERAAHALRLDRAALSALFKDPSFAGILRSEAVTEVQSEIARTAPGFKVRSAIELAQLLEEAGDLMFEEIADRCEGDAAAWLRELEGRGLARAVDVPGPGGNERRWIPVGQAEDLLSAFEEGRGSEAGREALKRLVARHLRRQAPVTIDDLRTRYPVARRDLEEILAALETEQAAVWGYFLPDTASPQWAGPDVIERMQRRSLAILRKEVRPVSPLRYAGEVRRLHGLTGDASSQFMNSATNCLDVLAGLPLPRELWNEIVFPSRLGAGWHAGIDALIRSGDYVWVALQDEARSPMVTVFPRNRGNSYLPDSFLEYLGQAPAEVTSAGRTVFEFLKGEGVATSPDLRAAFSGMSVSQLRDALRELAINGLVTADSWGVLDALFATSLHRARDHAESRQEGGRMQEARRSAARAIREASAALPSDVKWSLTTRYAVLGPANTTGREQAATRARALAARHGVVSRRSVDVEGNRWTWGAVLSELGLLEMRGSVRRGYFVAGLPGLQYAFPESVESLRRGRDGDSKVEFVNAADPAYILDRSVLEVLPEPPALLTGVVRVPSTWVGFMADVPVFVAGDSGRRIRCDISEAGRGQRADAIIQALRNLAVSLGGRLTVEIWNERPVLDTVGAEFLTAAGFRRDYPGMTFDAVQARALQASSQTS
ncbi:MAG: DEAD/DEAH box helicase [Chloroflexi bacterium]|nr:DEAD/DEAH box helicase [Chloroflexota bacterium]